VLQFSDRTTALPPVRPLEDWEARLALVDLLEAQREYRELQGRYTTSLRDLGFETTGLTLDATSTQFRARLGGFTIDHEWRLERT
jgi:type II secretory pathway pseudopilin PulG